METYQVIVVFLLSISSPVISQTLRLSLGESCGAGMRCVPAEECSKTQNIASSRPKICGFERNEPILCCNENLPTLNSKAIAMCNEYNRTYCTKFIGKPFIVGGYKANPIAHRHMAAIGYGSDDSVQWLCGGSIISERFILSAAHCAQSPSGQDARYVRVTKLDLPTKYQEFVGYNFLITKTIVHPDYSSTTFYNDIALFEVHNNLLSTAKPICLSTIETIRNGKATAAGWGKIDFAGPTTTELMAVELSVVDSDKCKRQLGRSRGIPDGVNEAIMICAGEEKGGKDTCGGDSGGPLFFNRSSSCLKEQIGIVSFGRWCARPNTPAVYTKISAYIPWIESIVWP